MENSDLSKSHLLSNKMGVNLDVLHAAMLNWIGQHVNGAHIVRIDNRGHPHQKIHVLKELAEPAALGNNMCHRLIFSLSTGLRHDGLSLGRPRYEVVAQENAIAGCGLSNVRAASPVSI
jgi:hypothetical protein